MAWLPARVDTRVGQGARPSYPTGRAEIVDCGANMKAVFSWTGSENQNRCYTLNYSSSTGITINRRWVVVF